MTLSRLVLPLSLIAATASLTACGDDDDYAPPYVADLAEIHTTAAGRISQLVRDNGDTYGVSNAAEWGALVPDTIYRVYAVYLAPEASGRQVQVLSLSSVFSPFAVSMGEGTLKTDPVALTTIWRGGEYVNLSVSVPTDGGRHALGFADRGITTLSSGGRLLHITLCHDAQATKPNYPAQAYLSLPLRPYAATMTRGADSIEVTVNTTQGVQVHRLPY